VYQRVHCPFHRERTPSCVLYVDHYSCYGCGARGPLSDLGLAPGTEPEAPEPENLQQSLAHIDALPVRQVRGLSLPSDERSFYIVWPDRDYYKRRFLHSHGSKYIGASGHRKPWFWARTGGELCIVAEGELNALSIAEAVPYAVVSPGGSGDFSSKTAKKNVTVLVQYSTILIVADADAPGAKAVIDLYGELAGRVPTVKTLLMPEDANSILVSRGKEALQAEIEKAVG
jgi:hypothetical protein